MPARLTRRQALAGLAAATLSARASGATATGFVHGVASGDPDADSVVLWSRLSGVTGPTPVSWTVARDPDIRDVVAKGTALAEPARDYTVKVVADGLAPGSTYYYRFSSRDHDSVIGRTRTLPQGHVPRLGLAVASCSNHPFGHFNAYDAIARDGAVEFVLHLGDYIYEYGPDGYGGQVGAGIGRAHQPPHEIVTLGDYRLRHAQYKSDVGSRAMHAAHPLIPLWDDHESTNNPWMAGAENHQTDTEGEWSRRRAASLRAYYEWMPIREPAAGGSRAEYWRHFRFGDLASLVTLETRHTGRARQIEYADHLPELDGPDAARRFQREVLGAARRHMLSSDMRRFLFAALAESRREARRWRLIGNQIPMARVHVPPLDDMDDFGAGDPSDPTAAHKRQLARLGALDLPIYLDTWDGYPWAREQFYRLSREAGASDLLVLTGDSHSFWANRLRDGDGEPMGLELGTAGITSPGDFESLGPEHAAELDRRLAAHNDEVSWTDNLHRGYIRLVLGREHGRADFVAVDRIDAPSYRSETIRSVGIVPQDGTLGYA